MPDVPADFWHYGDLQAALVARHMGQVIRAYRMHPHHGRYPLAQEEVAVWASVTQSQLSRLETGPQMQRLDHLIHWAKLLKIPEDYLWFALPDELVEVTSRGLLNMHCTKAAKPSGADDLLTDAVSSAVLRLDGDYVETLRGRIRELVAMDLRFGGDFSSGIALTLFHSVHRKLGTNQADASIERDLYAAAGELGEVAGWLLYDAGQHDQVRRINHEALQLARMAGDHSMELLILQNMSMHAGALNRPVEALRIARMVLDSSNLSSRIEALFRIREARALAQLGDAGTARRTYGKARALYLDGVRDDDPAWAWWINDRELAWHEAIIHGDADNWRTAVDTFHGSIEMIPPQEVRRRYAHLASLLDAQIKVEAWHEADTTIRELAPFVDEVGSTRAALILLGAIGQLERRSPPSSLRDGADQLSGLLAGAGYRA